MMKTVLIVAMAKDRAIGRSGDLLWHLPNDLKRFKAITTGHAIIMGRKTYESLPNGALPNRRNIVISRRLHDIPNAEVYPDLSTALSNVANEEKVYIIGGGEIYQQTLNIADELHLTLVEGKYPDADTFFPEIDWSKWNIETEEHISRDAQNTLDSIYYYLTKK